MTRCWASSIRPRSAFAFTVLLAVATRSSAYQPLAEEKDSYEIYSILLRSEMPPEWKITAWAITQETQTFPHLGSTNIAGCLQISKDQESIYLPLVQDYTAKNKNKLVLERKFGLPLYTIIPAGQTSGALNLPFGASVFFDVSSVGFNRDGTRALVYVGHHCGSLCGGGGYHLLVKKDGKWQADQEYRGMSCIWVS